MATRLNRSFHRRLGRLRPNQSIARVLIIALAVFTVAALAVTSLGPRQFTVAHGDYQLTVTPPKLKRDTSYRLFEQQRFSELSAFEGEETTGSAAIRARLVIKKPKRDVVIWTRTLPTTLIPKTGVIMEWNHRPIVVLQGSYEEEDHFHRAFFIIGPEGRHVTNGWVNVSGSWQVTNDFLVYRDSQGGERAQVNLRLTFGSVVQESDTIYRSYLTNNAPGAKRDMERGIELLLRTPDRSYAEGNLWLGYARLYCIECALGDTNAAMEQFAEAKRWYGTNLLNLKAKQFEEKMAAFTPEKCRDSVLEWDRAFTHGGGAEYNKNKIP